MFGYMTELDTVEEAKTETIEADGDLSIISCHMTIMSTSCVGHDLESLFYKFLDEFLFLFSAEPYFIAKVRKNE